MHMQCNDACMTTMEAQSQTISSYWGCFAQWQELRMVGVLVVFLRITAAFTHHDCHCHALQGIAINPMWDRLGPLPIAVIYDNTFASNWSLQLPLRHLQRHVTIGQLVELSPVAWGQLVTGIVTKLVDLAPSCLDPHTTRSQHFAALAAEVTVVYGIFGVVNPRDILALFGCHLSSPEQKDRARPWAKALVRSLARSFH